MKKATTPPPPQTNPAKKLFIAAGICIVIAAIALAVIFIIPDKAKANAGDEDGLAMPTTFTKEATATFTGKDGKVKANLDIELAESQAEQEQGLMYRDSMAPNQGMLFVYKEPNTMNFWMKNTYMSLDMVFISADSTVYKVIDHTKPFSEEGISPSHPSLYVLELNAGAGKQYHIEPGDRFNWTRITK